MTGEHRGRSFTAAACHSHLEFEKKQLQLARWCSWIDLGLGLGSPQCEKVGGKRRMAQMGNGSIRIKQDPM